MAQQQLLFESTSPEGDSSSSKTSPQSMGSLPPQGEKTNGEAPDRRRRNGSRQDLFCYAERALQESRRQWPPEPRRGSSYSETQMREEVEHAAFRLPVVDAIDHQAANEMWRKARNQGFPERIEKGARSWSPDRVAQHAARSLRDRLQLKTPEGKRKVSPTPTAVARKAEQTFFGPIEGEMQLWRWLLDHPEAYNPQRSPRDLFALLREMRSIEQTVSSRLQITKKILWETCGVTLGKTVFGSGRKRPPWGRKADFDLDIPTINDFWRGGAEISFQEALRRRRAYEAAAKDARDESHAASMGTFKEGLTEVVYPFFRWYVGQEYSTSHLATLSRKWSEWADPSREVGPGSLPWEKAAEAPRLGRNRINGRLELEGEHLGRIYAPPLPDRPVRSFAHFIGHLRRRVALNNVTWENHFTMVKSAKKDARRDIQDGKDLVSLYGAIEELLIDQMLNKDT